VKILVIEDDQHILSLLTRCFTESGHCIESADNGVDGEYLASLNTYDVLILDWMLPQKSGIDLLQSLRGSHNTTPILLLTAKSDLDDKVTGLRVGADDYLSKPFELRELEARVDALYRRSLSKGLNAITLQDITIDLDSQTVKKQDTTISLTHKEYDLLLFLIKQKNRIISTPMIEEQLWSHNEQIQSNVIQVIIYNLRKKIGKDIIQSYRGLGYKIEDK
jgi:DNA-binding response OmpR family regulator